MQVTLELQAVIMQETLELQVVMTCTLSILHLQHVAVAPDTSQPKG